MINQPYTFSNGITVKNQWVMAPLSLPFSVLGHLTQEDVAFILERSKPFGMIVIGAHAISESAKAFDSSWFVGENLQSSEMAFLIETCHEQDIKVILQICDGTNKTNPHIINKWELKDILRMLLRFAEVTTMAIEAGLDGIEIHAANSYVFHGFLSPLTNKRQDEYGGDLSGRSKLLRQVIKVVDRIRLQLNQQFLMGIRFIPEETTGGMTLEETLSLINNHYLPTECLNYLHLSLRNWKQISTSGQLIVKELADNLPNEIALITSGQIYDQEVANEALKYVDLVSVGASIIETDLPFVEMPIQLKHFAKLTEHLEALSQWRLPENPLFFGPMTTESSYENGALSREEHDFYVKRSALVDGIILGATGISKEAMQMPQGDFLYTKAQMYSYKGLNQQLHRNQCLSIVQLYHAGLASALPEVNRKELEQAIEFDQFEMKDSQVIERIIGEFTRSIDLASQANFDGVELSFAPPSFWMDVLCKNLTNRRGVAFVEKALKTLKDYMLHKTSLKTLGIRLTPEFLIQNKVLLGHMRELLTVLDQTVDYISFNVIDVHNLMSQVSIEQCLKGNRNYPVLISGKVRTNQDMRDTYYKGWIPMMVRPMIFENEAYKEMKSKYLEHLPKGLKASIIQSGDWYFE